MTDSLPDPGRNRIGHFSDPAKSGAPETQREAAVAVYWKAGSDNVAVLKAIVASGERGMTDDELEERLSLRHQTASARRNDLTKDGWVENSGLKRKTRSGCGAAVWVLTPQGKAEWAERGVSEHGARKLNPKQAKEKAAPAMRTFVVPDCHGRYEHARGLLMKAGVIDAEGKRIPDVGTTVQLGDLANCVFRDRDGDIALLEAAVEWFDVLLVGNHEHPYWGGPAFSGFNSIAEVKDAIRALDWRPCHLVGKTLITHAGVAAGLSDLLTSAEVASEQLTAAWRETPRHHFFSSIGRARGGWDDVGGILWSDFIEERRDTSFSQVHGHTPVGPQLRRQGQRFVLNLDNDVRRSGRLIGVWLDEHGEPESSFVEFEA